MLAPRVGRQVQRQRRLAGIERAKAAWPLPARRITSPPPAFSTLVTCAPSYESKKMANGSAITCEKSDLDLDAWSGVWAPPNLPRPIVARLHAAVLKAQGDPGLRRLYAEMGGRR